MASWNLAFPSVPKAGAAPADEDHRRQMDSPVSTRELPPTVPPPSPAMGCDSPVDGSGLPAVVLPVLTRSACLLNLLFQDGTVDLELASSVVSLDPGLAFASLQLANRERAGDSNPIWLFPLAVVAAGRDILLQLVSRAPRLEHLSPDRRTHLSQYYRDAVLRAAAAQFLSRELGNCDPRKAFLTGLLLELPAMIKAALPGPSISPAVLLSSLCGALPSVVVTAAMAGPASTDRYDPLAPAGALARIADSLVGSGSASLSPAVALEKLALGPLWRFWEGTDVHQRCCLLGHCRELASWVSANLCRMDPWEFMARLERQKSWE